MFTTTPYIIIISTKIINYQQLSILFICATVVSTTGPIITGSRYMYLVVWQSKTSCCFPATLTGFVADKLGIYKAIIITGSLFLGFVHLPMLWLESVHRSQQHVVVEHNESIQLAANTTQLPSALPSEYIFPILLLIRILGYMGMDASLILLDAAGLAMTKKHGGDFGKQKMWSTLSMVIVPTLCGLLIDAISLKLGWKLLSCSRLLRQSIAHSISLLTQSVLGYTDYSIAFYIAAGFVVILVPILYQMEIEIQKNDQSIIATAKKVIGMIDVDVFLIVQILVGACELFSFFLKHTTCFSKYWNITIVGRIFRGMGFHLTFLSVYVDSELIASKTLYGSMRNTYNSSLYFGKFNVSMPALSSFQEWLSVVPE